ncbi:F-box protein [Canna indica]|uniref:F-box protein n=1 Tax=Canna indica TaxID=4628 RepID=A0AAQ3K7N2_9LILI|nr:F-box protein [Canna indica]
MDEDVLSMEILPRLPLKSLFRFKCVGKSWHRLIADDDHLRRRLPLLTTAVFYHSDSTSKEPRFACTSSDAGELQESALDFFPFHRNSTIIDCCGGLLLSYATSTSSFYVLSPITKRWVTLPPARKSTHLAVLAFDPYHSKEFKVISFAGWLPQGAQLEVFSSETSEWAERSVEWGIGSDAMTATLRYFAGVLYILAFPNYIVAVDLDGGMQCRRIQLPETVKPEGCIDKSGGFLHYTCNEGSRIRIWVLEDDDAVGDGGRGKWALKHSVEVGAISRKLPAKLLQQQQQLHLMALHPERDVVYLRSQEGLVAYDMSKEEAEVACELRKEKQRAYLVQIWLFPFSRCMSDCLTDAN